MYVCVCVCMYVCMYGCMNVCMYVFVYVCMCVCVCICMCVCVCMNVYMYVIGNLYKASKDFKTFQLQWDIQVESFYGLLIRFKQQYLIDFLYTGCLLSMDVLLQGWKNTGIGSKLATKEILSVSTDLHSNLEIKSISCS